MAQGGPSMSIRLVDGRGTYKRRAANHRGQLQGCVAARGKGLPASLDGLSIQRQHLEISH